MCLNFIDVEIILETLVILHVRDSNGYGLDVGLVRKFVRFLLTRHVLRLDIPRTAWMYIVISFGRIIYTYR